MLSSLKSIATHKLYSAINILGLAVGLAACLMISLFVRYELTYDSFFAEADNIYRLSPDYPATATGPERHPVGNAGPLAPLILENKHEDVVEAARLMFLLTTIVGEELVAQERLYYADSAFFRMFDFEWLRGTPQEAFARPDNIVITASQAERFFGDKNPLGRMLTLDDRNPMRVSGVIADMPDNTHLTNGMFVPFEHLSKQVPFLPIGGWRATLVHTYVQLREGANVASVVDAIASSVAAAFVTANNAEPAPTFTAYALKDIHMKAGREGELKTPGNSLLVAGYVAIAAALLLIACINYVNLATARTAARAREVGIRKTAGAGRRELFAQFLGESFLIVLIAVAVALTLVEVLLPVFSSIVGKPLDYSQLAEPVIVLLVVTLAVFTALAAGAYPAFWLSSFNPAQVLRPQGTHAQGGVVLRNVLVVVQFTLAIALVTATLVIDQQMDFVRNMDLGFDKEQVLVARGTNEKGLGQQWPILKREMLTHPNVVSVTEGSLFPGIIAPRKIRLEGGASDGIDVISTHGGYNFLESYGVALRAGRYFDEQLISDALTLPGPAAGSSAGGSYVLSESAARALGLSAEEAVGRRMEMDFSRDFTSIAPGVIIGVVEDIHPFSLHETPKPSAFYVPATSPGAFTGTMPATSLAQPALFNQASIRLAGSNSAAVIEWIHARWKLLSPNEPMFHEFLDTRYAALYQEEEQQARFFTFFAALTTGVACLGLFGLTSFSVEKRFREIGIRKVMGSSVWQVVLLLTNDFSKLVLISNLIAWPLAYFAMDRWLQNFAYRIDLTPVVFIGSGLIALCIAWVTVGGTAAKAASQKPVLALRYE